MSHRWSRPVTQQFRINDGHHVAFSLTFKSITLGTEQVHQVKDLKIPHGRSWKSQRRCRIWKGEKV